MFVFWHISSPQSIGGHFTAWWAVILSFFLSTCTSLHHACVWWTCGSASRDHAWSCGVHTRAIGMAGHGHVFYGSPQVVLKLGYFSNGSSLTFLRHDWTSRQTTVWLRPSPSIRRRAASALCFVLELRNIPTPGGLLLYYGCLPRLASLPLHNSPRPLYRAA